MKACESLKKKGFGQVWSFIWEGFGEGFGRGLEVFGVSESAFGRYFFMLVLGMVFRRALGGFWPRFWLDLVGFGRDLGRV